MPDIWLTLKKSLQCKAEASGVHEPTAKKSLRDDQNRKISSCPRKRSLSKLRDVIHGSKRFTDVERPSISCPKSLVSNDFLQPFTREVVLDESSMNLQPLVQRNEFRKPNHMPKKIHGQFHGVSSVSANVDFDGSSGLICKKCNEKLKSLDAVQEHHNSQHAVSELVEGDSSRKIVEIICKPSCFIERVVKVHHSHVTLSQFEEYRETVKNKASKFATKNPRCLADGNELLRFYGSLVGCSLALNGSSSLCRSGDCRVCTILRYGFTRNEVGILTSSSSESALEDVDVGDKRKCVKKAMLVCRVIAGRIHKPVENFSGKIQSGFDSLAVKMCENPNFEELYVLNPKALLPCFVVIVNPEC